MPYRRFDFSRAASLRYFATMMRWQSANEADCHYFVFDYYAAAMADAAFATCFATPLPPPLRHICADAAYAAAMLLRLRLMIYAAKMAHFIGHCCHATLHTYAAAAELYATPCQPIAATR